MSEQSQSIRSHLEEVRIIQNSMSAALTKHAVNCCRRALLLSNFSENICPETICMVVSYIVEEFNQTCDPWWQCFASQAPITSLVYSISGLSISFTIGSGVGQLFIQISKAQNSRPQATVAQVQAPQELAHEPSITSKEGSDVADMNEGCPKIVKHMIREYGMEYAHLVIVENYDAEHFCVADKHFMEDRISTDLSRTFGQGWHCLVRKDGWRSAWTVRGDADFYHAFKLNIKSCIWHVEIFKAYDEEEERYILAQRKSEECKLLQIVKKENPVDLRPEIRAYACELCRFAFKKFYNAKEGLTRITRNNIEQCVATEVGKQFGKQWHCAIVAKGRLAYMNVRGLPYNYFDFNISAASCKWHVRLFRACDREEELWVQVQRLNEEIRNIKDEHLEELLKKDELIRSLNETRHNANSREETEASLSRTLKLDLADAQKEKADVKKDLLEAQETIKELQNEIEDFAKLKELATAEQKVKEQQQEIESLSEMYKHLLLVNSEHEQRAYSSHSRGDLTPTNVSIDIATPEVIQHLYTKQHTGSFQSKLPCPTPSFYCESETSQYASARETPAFPEEKDQILDQYLRLSPDTLFFTFYYMETTEAQHLASKALKKLGWMLHTKYRMWFQRQGEPIQITEEYEEGAYMYFDVNKWTQRRKKLFRLLYKYIERLD